ncbi:Hypothetical protein D9617_15g043500 [Elsinoe fawcettii]|nr:Hypothetical protein D9617_15g043500 [Elsinoe fawcettii]
MPPTPFFCTLCAKGYLRAPELEAHENSYDHQHKKRLKEMTRLTRNPTSAVKDSRAEKRRRENNEMISVNLQDVKAKEDAGRGERGFRPIGFGEQGREPVRGLEEEEKAKDKDEEEFVLVEGPIPWEKLGEVGESVDLSVNRPWEVQRIMERVEAHEKTRKDKAYYEDVWRRVNALKGGEAGSESPPEERVGLGA